MGLAGSGGQRPPRVALLARGDRGEPVPSDRTADRLGPLLAAFDAMPVVVEHVAFADNAMDEVREQLLSCDGVLVWVNPIQDGQTRAGLDALLRNVAASGVFVSAHPDTIDRLATKEVLYRLRRLPWGSDVELYRTAADFSLRFPGRLAQYGQLVVKQGRGNGGDGVWKVERAGPTRNELAALVDEGVIVRDGRATDGSSTPMPLRDFIALASECFGWSGCLVDQPFQDRLADGMLRCYFTQDHVVGFSRQWPKRGLLGPQDAVAAASGPASVMLPADASQYQDLAHDAETHWLPELMAVLGLDAGSLPLIWDADFLLGPKTDSGHDTYVLCEINASAVWPFPPTAAPAIARATVAAVKSARPADGD